MMSQVKKKNRRLCETLKLLRGFKIDQELSKIERDEQIKCAKQKTAAPSSLSMMKFYQSIPSNLFTCKLFINILQAKSFFSDYDEIRHLPEYDFSEKVELLKKIHCDLSDTLLDGNVKRPASSMSRGKKRKSTPKKKKKTSATKKSAVSPSLCNVSHPPVLI